MMAWRCWIKHRWIEYAINGTTTRDPFPFNPGYKCWRKCERCSKKQRWLPGYGGSELGCWRKSREELK